MSGPQKLPPKGKAEMTREESEEAQLKRDQELGEERRREDGEQLRQATLRARAKGTMR